MANLSEDVWDGWLGWMARMDGSDGWLGWMARGGDFVREFGTQSSRVRNIIEVFTKTVDIWIQS